MKHAPSCTPTPPERTCVILDGPEAKVGTGPEAHPHPFHRIVGRAVILLFFLLMAALVWAVGQASQTP